MKKSVLLLILLLNFNNSIKSISIFESNKTAKAAFVASAAVATYGYIERRLAQKELNDLEKDKARVEKVSSQIANQLGDFLLVQYKKIRTKMRTVIAIRFPTAELGFSPIDIAKAQSTKNPELDRAREDVSDQAKDIDAEMSKFKQDKFLSTILFALGSAGSLSSAYYLFKKNYRISFSLIPVK